MASQHCPVPPSQSILAFNHPFIKPTLKLTLFSPNRDPSVASLHSNLSPRRFKIGVRFQERPKLDKNVVSASNNNPPEGSVVEKRDGTAKGPPFLTILAGLVVFAAIYLVVGSIVKSLIDLAVNLFFK